MTEFPDVTFEYTSDPTDRPECPVCGCIVDEPDELCTSCEEMAEAQKWAIYEHV